MQLSKRLIDGITDFFINNIESRAMEGITYALALKGDKDLIDKGKEIKDAALENGFKNDEAFRIYELSNGYIFDMDSSLTEYISKKILKAAYPEEDFGYLLTEKPKERRRNDMMSLAKLCQSKHKSGVDNFEIALFSRNSVPRIVISGTEASGNVRGKPVMVTYNAYAIRHWDIQEVNDSILSNVGIRISKIRPCEILPSRTGVRFEITVDENI